MVEVAQRVGGEPSRRDEARFDSLEQRMTVRNVGRGWASARPRVAWLGGMAAAACLLVALGTFWQSTPAALSYAVVDGAVVGGVVVASEHTKIRFSDGSEVSLQPGAQASIAGLTARGGRLRLQQGRAKLDIAKKPDASWFVDAGPYAVRVTGTAFDVRWSSAERKFELDLHHGSVVVTGPQIGAGLTLSPGQRLVGRAEGPVTVEGPRSMAAAKVKPSEPNSPLPAPTPSVGLPLPASELQADARSETSSAYSGWARQVAQGKFQSVIDEAQRRGLEQALSTASLEELSALADAARYASRTAIARRALLAARQRFPRSAPAREAAFFLGRLAEESGQGALEWYDRYLAESPKGPYAAQALGRRMMIFYRQQGKDSAQPLARSYLERFPNGPYASAARKIIAQPATKNP
jgi:hypothetical protein